MSLLLETILGLGLFSVVILVLFGIFGAVGRSNSQAREHAMARNLAQAALNRECGKPYASVMSVPALTVTEHFVSNGVNASTDFRVEIVVTELVPGERKSVLAVVTWNFGDANRQFQLENFVVSL